MATTAEALTFCLEQKNEIIVTLTPKLEESFINHTHKLIGATNLTELRSFLQELIQRGKEVCCNLGVFYFDEDVDIPSYLDYNFFVDVKLKSITFKVPPVKATKFIPFFASDTILCFNRGQNLLTDEDCAQLIQFASKGGRYFLFTHNRKQHILEAYRNYFLYCRGNTPTTCFTFGMFLNVDQKDIHHMNEIDHRFQAGADDLVRYVEDENEYEAYNNFLRD